MAEHLYVYSWHADETQKRTQIRCYGIDKNGHTTALIISDFTPYVYIELPNSEDWKQVLRELESDIANKTILTKIIEKQHLYKGKGVGRFLFCQCSSRKYIGYISYMLKTQTYRGYKLMIHEEQANSVLQLVSLRQVPMATWLSFSGIDVDDDCRQTSCDREIAVSWKSLNPSNIQTPVFPKTMAFDLEVNSEVMNAMPSNKPMDMIFQISCVIEHASIRRKILLTMSGVDLDSPLLEGIEVCSFETEEDLLFGFIDLLKRERPNVLTGYNILMFDISYLMKRCERYGMMEDLQLAGYNNIFPADKRSIKWSSSAFSNQEYTFMEWEGILLMDLLPIIRRDYKFENYKLDTVSSILIGAEKDPVDYKEIFAAFRSKKMARVGKYCVQDSNLCIDLFNHIHCWISLAEMAVVCKVSMFALYTQGQQVKIYGQVYDYCLRNNILVTSNGYECKTGERYLGAYVMDPVPGFYENVVPLDFNSLYPSLIIAHNICYSTFITDSEVTSTPPNHFNTFEWEDHVGCEHDPKIIEIANLTKRIDALEKRISIEVTRRTTARGNAKKTIQEKINAIRNKQRPIRKLRTELKKGKPANREDVDGNIITGIICAKRKYRFLKKEIKQGVIPTIIRNLLDSRKRVKLEMKTCSQQEKVILDKKQLAYKVSANSQYGAMGVRRGMLPFMPGAMCITYLGRQAIQKAGDLACNKYNGKWIYTDTDSTYITFPHLSEPQTIWDFAIHVAKQISAEFPEDMTIEFEQAIYKQFVILSKKRYMYRSSDRDGKCDDNIGKRGVVIARRDNSKLLRIIYEKVIEMIFAGKSQEEVEYFLIEYISNMFRRLIPLEHYISTKSIKSTDDGPEKIQGRLGDYKARMLPANEQERNDVLAGRTERQYYIDSCPAQVQLAERMRLRGFPVDVGSRMEFVVLCNNKTSLGKKMEDATYFMKRKQWLKIDSFYYLKSFINPVDQLLSVALGSNNFVAKQFVYRNAYSNVLKELKSIFAPSIHR